VRPEVKQSISPLLLIFVLHQLHWVKLDNRKVKFLTVDFTEEVKT
jgi:hypothetical protein